MRHILIVGATSAIAEAAARHLATAGHRLFLVARNEAKLTAIADDLRIRGASQVEHSTMDATDYARHVPMLDDAWRRLGSLDTVLIAYGSLPDQKVCEASFATTRRELEINALSVISLLTEIANRFETQKEGTIAVISSVAGDRGRQSNYVYGTAKGALNLFLQGLRNRLHSSGVRVVTIKPGFVDTPMTVQFQKGRLWATAEHVGRRVAETINGSGDVVYIPGFWRLVMILIRATPESLFKRLSL